MKQRLVLSLMLMFLIVVMVISTGCSAPGMTSKEVHRRHYETVQNDFWQFQEDIDAFLLIDRPSRLNRMMVR